MAQRVCNPSSFRVILAMTVSLLLAGCGDDPVAPEPQGRIPPLAAVTAPRSAPPGSTVLVRVHWLDDCMASARFEGFLVRHAAGDTLVLDTRWTWESRVCFGINYTGCEEEVILVAMPAAGPLQFSVRMGNQRIDRRIESGPAVEPGIWSVDVLDAVTRLPAVGASLKSYRIERIPELDSWTIVDTLYADTTGSDGRHEIDLGARIGAPLDLALIATHQEPWNMRVMLLPGSTGPPPGGELSTVLVLRAR